MLWSQFSAILPNFQRKNWRFSQKPMLGCPGWGANPGHVMITFSAKLPFVWVKNADFFHIFLRKSYKNHDIGPWCYTENSFGAKWIGNLVLGKDKHAKVVIASAKGSEDPGSNPAFREYICSSAVPLIDFICIFWEL
jgi:hypothetical protein